MVEIPKPVWTLILHGIILRTRPAKSAAKYASVWTPEGSPLMVWTRKQAALLKGFLGEQGHQVSHAVADVHGPKLGRCCSQACRQVVGGAIFNG